jgi:hypothetical protein
VQRDIDKSLNYRSIPTPLVEHTCTVMMQAPLEAQRGRRAAGAWTVEENRAKPSPPLETRLPTICGHTGVCLLTGQEEQTGADARRPGPLASGMSRCRTLSEEREVFRRRCRYFHGGRKGMRVLRHKDRALQEQCWAGERRQYPWYGSAKTTGCNALEISSTIW